VEAFFALEVTCLPLLGLEGVAIFSIVREGLLEARIPED
jgi:hypothetical protein